MHISRCSAALLCTFVLFLFIIQGLLIGMLMWYICDNASVPSGGSNNSKVIDEERPREDEPKKPWSDIRLPNNLIPNSYDINLRPILDDATSNALYGSMDVTYLCKIPTKYTLLHSKYIKFDLSKVSLKTGNCDVEITNVTFYELHEYVIFESKEKCDGGKYYTLSILQYVTSLSHNLWGLYRSTFEMETVETRTILSSHMQPTGARKVFPCFDEPGFKANFTITIWFRPVENRLAISNMPAKKHTTKEIDGVLWNSTTFEETFPMATYILAFAICDDYSFAESSSATGIKVRTFAPKEWIANGTADYATKTAPIILDHFQDFFGVEYPLTKADQIVVPQLVFGAMENWGLVMYKKKFLLVDDNSTIRDKLESVNTISHELVHMWFGNLVTPTFWNDIWLNEGFATYFSYSGAESVYSTWNSKQLFFLEIFYQAMDADDINSSHPIIHEEERPDSIFEMFDAIVYKKGGCMLRMINAFLGDEVFMNGLKAYLKDLSYNTTTTDTLFKYWENAINKTENSYPASISEMLTPWTTQAGYPLLNVKRENDVYSITQERFLRDEESSYDKYRMELI
uniref:aminopeptidase Ey-like n=1 Tax=Styela clava TaxID=7725 RepID=UPI00193AB3DD|nr:aminopeptidase Ey-like [Styela clava]